MKNQIKCIALLMLSALAIFINSCKKSKNNSTTSESLFQKYFPHVDTATFVNVWQFIGDTYDTLKFSENGVFTLSATDMHGNKTTNSYKFTVDSVTDNEYKGNITDLSGNIFYNRAYLQSDTYGGPNIVSYSFYITPDNSTFYGRIYGSL